MQDLFRRDIDRIMALLPPKGRRQTALFSATFPADIQKLATASLRPGYQLVDTVGETEDETAEKASSTLSLLHDVKIIMLHSILFPASIRSLSSRLLDHFGLAD